eukprot:CAMPEP_0172553448 /NCGR_PEP_ID=MMETSP1067-20121228/50980_1 /TAXON_ID=265564 ORGANISM="Thalassiosira punctigera, Strain Tpunct2005C2" /NCGR_SAMPLE_ID=MMETSP1067 /ASSEMBLY_ACC=CAM_ASM_000444 /LENGTH=174 /DNA_ID=CAMNT_0013341639 /DNA_START=64 /DNA_END=588 /DNA_ORIENTATION=+
MLLSTTLMAVIAMTITSNALSFSIQLTPCRCLRYPRKAEINRNSRSHPSCHYGIAIDHTIHILNLAERGIDDDDGLGDKKVETESSSSAESESTLPDRISKSQELAKLQNEFAMKQSRQKLLDPVNPSPANTGGERDLFIPIVTLVAVVGFTGLYGYEMLRLYVRGELYLPWEH